MLGFGCPDTSHSMMYPKVDDTVATFLRGLATNFRGTVEMKQHWSVN